MLTDASRCDGQLETNIAREMPGQMRAAIIANIVIKVGGVRIAWHDMPQRVILTRRELPAGL